MLCERRPAGRAPWPSRASPERWTCSYASERAVRGDAVHRRTTQIECQRKVGIARLRRHLERARRVTDAEEPRQPPAFGLIAVHGKRLEGAAARMRDVIHAPAKRSLIPRIDDIEAQRRAEGGGWMQTVRPPPTPIPDSGDEF